MGVDVVERPPSAMEEERDRQHARAGPVEAQRQRPVRGGQAHVLDMVQGERLTAREQRCAHLCAGLLDGQRVECGRPHRLHHVQQHLGFGIKLLGHGRRVG